MELKKNPEVDLERTRRLFHNVGLIVVMSIVLAAFTWKQYDSSLADLAPPEDIFEELEDIPVTEQPPPPPPPIQQPEIIEVPDEEEIEEEIEVVLDVEINEESEIEEMIFDEPVEEEVAEEIFTVVEDQPEFPGGMSAFYQYIGDNMKYPSQARRMGIEGRVYVQFVVDKSGNITEVQAVRGIGAGCDEEAVRVIKGMPQWKPGKQRGRAVKVRMILPITFKLG